MMILAIVILSLVDHCVLPARCIWFILLINFLQFESFWLVHKHLILYSPSIILPDFLLISPGSLSQDSHKFLFLSHMKQSKLFTLKKKQILTWSITSLKSDSNLPKKNFFICFNDRPSKIMKNAFYFILKEIFVLEIFKFLFWLFGHVEKLTWLER